MARAPADIEKEIQALGRTGQVRLLRPLLEELKAHPDATSPSIIRAQIEIDLAASNEYIAQYGSFAELARAHFAAADDESV